MYETFKRFTDESLFAARGADPYVQSHPMPAERVRALEELARSSPYWTRRTIPLADAPRHGARKNLRLHGAAGHRLPALSVVEHSLPARYAHAISTYLPW